MDSVQGASGTMIDETNEPWTLIAVHGVGNPAPGSVIASIARAMGPHEAMTASEVTIDGVGFPRLSTKHGQKLIEVNWSDIQRPLRSSCGVVKHLALLMLAMLTAGFEWDWGGRPIVARAVTYLYRLALEVVVLWTVALPAFSLLIVDDRRAIVIQIGAAAAAAAVALSIIFGRYRKPIRIAGLVWAGLYLGVALWRALSGTVAVDRVVHHLATAYQASQILGAALLTCAWIAVVADRSSGAGRLRNRLTRGMFLIVPCLAAMITGPVLMAAALHVTGSAAAGIWRRPFSDALDYNLPVAEFAMLGILSSVALLALAAAAVYAWWPKRRTGAFARRCLGVLIWLLPCAFALVGVLFFADLLWLNQADFARVFPARLVNLTPDTVYQISALRVLAVLPFLVGPLALVLDIVGDVTFYLPSPGRHGGSGRSGQSLSIKQETNARLRSALVTELRSEETGPIAIIAHSQGSVIAATVLGELFASGSLPSNRRVVLLTLGSPIDSLYSGFLGDRVGPDLADRVGGITWINRAREDDYIGGAINRASPPPENQVMGSGGHTGYWHDFELSWLATPAACEPAS